jgi:hypothetical protein
MRICCPEQSASADKTTVATDFNPWRLASAQRPISRAGHVAPRRATGFDPWRLAGAQRPISGAGHVAPRRATGFDPWLSAGVERPISGAGHVAPRRATGFDPWRSAGVERPISGVRDFNPWREDVAQHRRLDVSSAVRSAHRGLKPPATLELQSLRDAQNKTKVLRASRSDRSSKCSRGFQSPAGPGHQSQANDPRETSNPRRSTSRLCRP